MRNLVTGRSARVDDPDFDGLDWRADFLGGLSGDGRMIPFVSSAYDGKSPGSRRQTLFLRTGW